jgi:hypothetical protein
MAHMGTTVVLHIGTHKTGSTSLQRFLRDENGGALASVGARFPEGVIHPDNHLELQILAMRPERRTEAARRRHPETLEPAWIRSTEDRVRAEIAGGGTIVYSAETLSYLRFPDELDRLLALLSGAGGSGGTDVQMVMYTRDPAAFLRSYTLTLRLLGVDLSADPESNAYVQPDTWLVDYASRIALWERFLGAERVTVLDYDALVAAEGSVIPSFARVLGIEPAALGDLSGYFLNRSDAHREKIRQSLRE